MREDVLHVEVRPNAQKHPISPSFTVHTFVRDSREKRGNLLDKQHSCSLREKEWKNSYTALHSIIFKMSGRVLIEDRYLPYVLHIIHPFSAVMFCAFQSISEKNNAQFWFSHLVSFKCALNSLNWYPPSAHWLRMWKLENSCIRSKTVVNANIELWCAKGLAVSYSLYF